MAFINKTTVSSMDSVKDTLLISALNKNASVLEMISIMAMTKEIVENLVIICSFHFM
ncbi:hypothetical protein [Cytobacillus gottheilii]|uniref:hypothetical protein n=1 Tax=Cytobacillus gottheilii TaxID=859144 RepID=UPI001C57CAE2|nr:hypothetical protein [Cytobacillus gottheilii]